jgi:hypothetical protein
MDFLHDQFSDGRRFRILAIVDDLLLWREGLTLNHKKLRRIYDEERLQDVQPAIAKAPPHRGDLPQTGSQRL